jgi:HEAT repeat protein
MGARDELRSLYDSEQDPRLRMKLLQAFGVADDVEGLARAARSESDPRVKSAAIEGLAIAESGAAVRTLLEIYRGSSEVEIKRKVLEALMIQDQAKALIALFREEKNPELKRAIVQQLSLLDSDEAQQVLLDVLEEMP